MTFQATLKGVFNRSSKRLPEFLPELMAWAATAPDDLFAPNPEPKEIFTLIKPILARKTGKDQYVWDSLLHRKAALLEAMRVHAGFESSWNWTEGVDRTNASSQKDPNREETGIFQVSYDSSWLGGPTHPLRAFLRDKGVLNVKQFIAKNKEDKRFALEYYARLVRLNIIWAGPLIRTNEDSVVRWLNVAAMQEFMQLLSPNASQD